MGQGKTLSEDEKIKILQLKCNGENEEQIAKTKVFKIERFKRET